MPGRASRLSDERIVDTLLNRSGGMPPIDLSDQEAADVLSWLRREFCGGWCARKERPVARDEGGGCPTAGEGEGGWPGQRF